MSFSKISVETKNGIYEIGFGANETKSMTTLTKETLLELQEAVAKVAADKEAKGLIFFSHKPGCFLAGVDVSIIQGLSSEAEAIAGCEGGQTIYNQIEDLKIPTAALVDGVCLGGGLELSLACKKIFISDNPKTALGLPEVMLGVLPGFGGTYRLPRKVGLPTSLDMILTGKQIRGKKCLKLGLAEKILPTERMLELAPTYLFKKEVEKSFKESLSDAAMDNFITRKIIFQKARETVLKTTKGFYPAPLKILDLIEGAYGKKRSSYLAMEAKAFAELSQTQVSKSLQHVFFLQDNSKKMSETKVKKIKKGAVLGAGTMGGGIAWLMANSEQAPIMKDINTNGLVLGLKQASSVFRKDVLKKKLSQDDFERKMRSITPVMNYDGFNGVDLVIEAVVENMNVKKKVFAEMEKEVSKDCLLTSNTSSLSINEMSSALEYPERFAGLHFFNPVNKMPLVEIIKHDKVSEETINALYKWCLDVKKTPVVVGDGPGFLVNRILMPFINESAYLLEEGVSVEDLDKAVLSFGMPMGTCRLMDEVGIDVLVHVGEIMDKGLGARAKACSLSAKAADKGMLGRKTSKGFYIYDAQGKQGEVNPEMLAILPKQNKRMEEAEIQKRVFLPMINEAANILKEKIVEKADIVDLGLIFGIGFPPFRGGLLRYADNEGLENIYEAIKNFENTISAERYEVSSLLKDLVDRQQKFYDL
jgi:3-hydroxyacyl-CoA dehydrogenase/enoyl-CoA hydratase/3-hydroxybutyryl-CoA epimerase